MSEPLHPEVVILNAALELPPADRAAYLDQACAGDHALRRQVETLLAAHPQAATFLETPAPGHLALARTELARVPLTEKPGDHIGRYKLLQQIGEGGCGVVYMAEQEEPVRRRVALKVIKLGMDTREVIARFEAERQALALMDHPHIAKVFDAGATQTGRPYFVMELVRGVRLTEFCDENKLSTEARLRLFIQVCQAIQHAHQKGVIHRDIKPSNILVTRNDPDLAGVPKVIDFGIAKATTGRLTDRTLFTAFEQFIGTPAYMSPEQAVMTSLDVDTRSDIYSLGVLLYELLTGQTPFDARELSQGGIDEIRRTIREQEPPRPSTRLSTMAAAALQTTARLRHTDPPRLVHVVRGDLDWIVMKCLEKDRTRRYESASALAADLQRHLNHEPVLARPPGRAYQLRKLVRRHRLAFAAGAAIAAALVLGLALALWQYAGKSRAYDRVVQAEKTQDALRRRAELEAGRSRQVAAFLRDMLRTVGPAVARGRDVSVLREMLDQTAARVGQGLTNQPGVEAELRDSIGQVYLTLGELEKAEAMQREALRLLRTLPGEDQLDVADALNNLGSTLMHRGQFADAERCYLESLALRRRLAGGNSAEVGDSLLNLGALYAHQERLPESEATFREAVAHLRAARGDEDVSVAKALSGLGQVLQRLGRLPQAEATLLDAIARMERTAGQDSFERLKTLTTLGHLQADGARLEEAERTFRDRLTAARRYYGDDHPEVAESLSNLAYVLRRRHQLDAAESLIHEALAIERKRLGDRHPTLAGSLVNLANVQRDQGRLTNAELSLREALRIHEESGAGNLGNSLGARINLATLLHFQDRTPEAVSLLQDAAARLRADGGTNGIRLLPHALNNLGTMLDAQGQHAEAEAVQREAIDLCRQSIGNAHPLLPNSLLNLAFVLSHRKRPAEAESNYVQAIELLATAGPARDPRDLAHCQHNLACLLRDQGRHDEAEARYLAAIAAWRKSQGNHHPDLARSLHDLAMLLLDRGQPARAEPLEREALEIRRRRLGSNSPPARDAVWSLGLILEAQRKWTEAEPCFVEAIDLLQQQKGPSDPSAVNLLERLARLRLELGRFPEAQAAAAECLAAREAREPTHWRTFEARSLLGGALLAQKAFTAAEPHLLAACEGLQRGRRQIPRGQRDILPRALDRLAELYDQTNRPEQAAETRRRKD